MFRYLFVKWTGCEHRSSNKKNAIFECHYHYSHRHELPLSPMHFDSWLFFVLYSLTLSFTALKFFPAILHVNTHFSIWCKKFIESWWMKYLNNDDGGTTSLIFVGIFCSDHIQNKKKICEQNRKEMKRTSIYSTKNLIKTREPASQPRFVTFMWRLCSKC